MRKLLLILLALFLIAGCSRATPESEKDSTAKIIIEGVFDKSTGEVIENATMIIHVEREGKEALVYEEYEFSEYVIRGEIGDYVLIEVNAPGYETWELGIRLNKTGFVQFPIEMYPENYGKET